MLDFSIISTAPTGFFVYGILATLLVAVSKAGFGGAMGALSLPLMLLVLRRAWPCRFYCRFFCCAIFMLAGNITAAPFAALSL